MNTIILTGGIGSGKTFISNIFNSLFEIPIFNTDVVAKNIMIEEKIRKDIINILGNTSINESGELNHKYIGDLIFFDEDIRRNLESFMYPRVISYFENFKKENQNNHKYCIFECANFFDIQKYHNINIIYDYIIGVYANEKIRMQRIIDRSNWTELKIKKVIDIQINQNDLLSMCDYIIINENENDVLIDNIKQIHNKIDNQIKEKRNYCWF